MTTAAIDRSDPDLRLQMQRYIARVIHADVASRKRHEAMGFEQAWGRALEQLVTLMKDRT